MISGATCNFPYPLAHLFLFEDIDDPQHIHVVC